MRCLIIAEHDNSTISGATLNTITAATKLSSDIDLLVAGEACASAAESATKIEHLSGVKCADNAAYAHQIAENIADLVVELASDYDYILAPSTTNGKNILPRAAALLDVQAISDVIEVIDADTFKRPIYAGNVIATVKSSDSKKLLSVRTTAFDAAAAEGGSAELINLDSVHDKGISQFDKEELAQSDRPELTAANIVISGGRGMQNGENFELLYKVADKLGAAVGASRAAVDSGFVPNDMQVGQTGKIVAPDLYIAVGISGAIQHLAGMKDSKVIVAINKDEDAPIFQVADYGLVADLFDAVPELESAL